ncbi:MAG: alpha/beta fold hydrolase [Lautropia sp.]
MRLRSEPPPFARHPAITALDAGAERRDLRHDGRLVRWRRFGAGAPLVLLHGGHGSWLHWLRNIAPLAARHTLWVPDLPGFGDSDSLAGPPHAPDRMQRLVAALIATLDQLVGATTPIGLAGFSFGALAAAELAAARGRVTQLALVGPAGHGGTRRQEASLADWRSSDLAAMRRALLHNLGAFMLHDPAARDDLALAVHAAACHATRFRSKAIAQAGGLQATLDRAAAPALLIWGEHDVTGVPRILGPMMTADRPQRRWHEIGGAGHWAQFERADAVNRLLLDWFDAQ